MKRPIPADAQLGFGVYFTDHMALVPFRGGRWQPGEIVPYGPLPLDPAASVLHYGQSIFEGMKAFLGTDGKLRLFRVDFHGRRMAYGAEAICMPAPPMDVFRQTIIDLVRRDRSFMPKTRGCSLYIRPTLVGSEGFLGVRPSEDYLFFVILSPVGNYYAEGMKPIKIHVEEHAVRAAPGGLGAVKAGANYAASMKAAYEAKQRGYSQVLWLDAVEHKYVEEVGTTNVFFRIGDEVITPPLAGTILGGVTRDSVLELLRDWGVKVSERRVSMDEVLRAQREGTLKEVFGTGTAAVISTIGELSYRGEAIRIGDGSMGALAKKLYDAITAVQYGEAQDKFGWTTLI